MCGEELTHLRLPFSLTIDINSDVITRKYPFMLLGWLCYYIIIIISIIIITIR